MSKRTFLLSVTAIALVGILFGAATNTINWTQLVSGDRHGTQTKGQASDGTGASGHIATYNADGSLTDGGAAGSGSFVLLQGLTAAASTELDFTSPGFTSTYDVYQLDCQAITVSVNQAYLRIQFHISGGAYDTGTNYAWAHIEALVGASTNATNGLGSRTGIEFFTDNTAVGLLNTATPAMTFTMKFFDPLTAANAKYVTFGGVAFYTSGSRYSFNGGGVWTDTTHASDAFRILVEPSGTFSGTCRLYGESH